jgi:hypothetical protein
MSVRIVDHWGVIDLRLRHALREYAPGRATQSSGMRYELFFSRTPLPCPVFFCDLGLKVWEAVILVGFRLRVFLFGGARGLRVRFLLFRRIRFFV